MKVYYILLILFTLVNVRLSKAHLNSIRGFRSYPAFFVDRQKISISGVSSGAFMAVQMQVAYSSLYSGLASFAGGIYACAEGQLTQALNLCMENPSSLPVNHFVEITHKMETSLQIDPLRNLQNKKIYIFSGGRDTVVAPLASKKLIEFLKEFTFSKNIKEVIHPRAEHGLPVREGGSPCDFLSSPWMLACDLDGAGESLRHIYGSLQPPIPMDLDHMYSFTQSEYTGPIAQMGPRGFLYIPTACTTGKRFCAFHVVLHGCRQSPDLMGDLFHNNSGFNEWAEANNIVILYPSARTSEMNPKACWDWWGYTGNYYYLKNGPQMLAIYRMTTELGLFLNP